MSKAYKPVIEEIPTKVPDHYRLDGRIGKVCRKYCCLLFPIGFPKYRAYKIIRRRLGLVPEDITERL